MANNNPIFSRLGDIQGGAYLTTQGSITTSDYSGLGIYNIPVFNADLTNGGFVQRLRFKAIGSVGAVGARVYINEGTINNATVVAAPTSPSGSAGSAGTLQSGTYYARIQSIDQYGVPSALSAETSGVVVTGPSGSIQWNWTAASGAASYRIFVGQISVGEYVWFTSTTNTFTQTVAYTAGQLGNPADYITNNLFYGEVSLPAVTASNTAATVDVDYPMNVALPPGYRILVGLSANVTTGGWTVQAIGGKY
jgi:hypothetical protein